MSLIYFRKLLLITKIRFLIVGFLNTIFGYVVYCTLLLFEVNYLIALLISTILGLIFNFVTFGKLVFLSHYKWINLIKFIIAYIKIYLINALSLEILTKYLYLNPYVGQIACIIPSAMISWLLMNYWVFKQRDGYE